MMPHQVTVFAENKPGRLEKITRALDRGGINIRAVTIASGEGFGVIKLLVDDPARAANLLGDEGLSASLNQVVAARMTDKPGGLHHIIEILSEKGINIDDAYGFIMKSRSSAAIIIDTEDPTAVAAALQSRGVELLTDKELQTL